MEKVRLPTAFLCGCMAVVSLSACQPTSAVHMGPPGELSFDERQAICIQAVNDRTGATDARSPGVSHTPPAPIQHAGGPQDMQILVVAGPEEQGWVCTITGSGEVQELRQQVSTHAPD